MTLREFKFSKLSEEGCEKGSINMMLLLNEFEMSIFVNKDKTEHNV